MFKCAYITITCHAELDSASRRKIADQVRNDIIDFATNQVTVEHGTVAQDKVVAGVVSDANTKITMKTHNHYTDPSEQFFAGIWSSSVGTKSVNNT